MEDGSDESRSGVEGVGDKVRDRRGERRPYSWKEAVGSARGERQ